MIRKIGVLLLFLFFNVLVVCSQDAVFVLVDVSGNPLNQPPHTHIKKSERNEAINFVRDLLQGTMNTTTYPDWDPWNLDRKAAQMYNNPTAPVLSSGSSVFLIPYGDHSKYTNVKEFKIQNPTNDISAIVVEAKGYLYSDQNTFEKLAVAKTVEIAKTKSLKNYLVFQISGLGGDQTGSEPYTASEKKMIDDFESTADIISLGSFRLKKTDKNYSISIKEFDISRLLNPLSPTTITTTPSTPSTSISPRSRKLEITSPTGEKESPFEYEPDKPLLITWRCNACSDNPNFQLNIQGIEGKEYHKSHTVVNSYSKRITLPDGEYKLSLSSQGMAATPVYISIGSGGSGSWLLFLFLLVIIGVVIYFAKDRLFSDNKAKNSTTRQDDSWDNKEETRQGKLDNNEPSSDGYF